MPFLSSLANLLVKTRPYGTLSSFAFTVYFPLFTVVLLVVGSSSRFSCSRPLCPFYLPNGPFIVAFRIRSPRFGEHFWSRDIYVHIYIYIYTFLAIETEDGWDRKGARKGSRQRDGHGGPLSQFHASTCSYDKI